MTLAAPKLDDRHFQDLVDEAKKRIPHYCKDWTDHNVSDPGVTLIELFAWMTDILLYRLNQVPDLHYIKFLEMLGIKLNGPIPARVPITFWLTVPQSLSIVIPAGTEVATTQTETEQSIPFTTDTDLQINPPLLNTVITMAGSESDGKKKSREINLRKLEAGFEGIEVFGSTPRPNDAFCIGFDNDLSYHLLGLVLDLDSTLGAGINPAHPPYLWEVSTGDRDRPWEPCDDEMDTTKGLNVDGNIQIHLPKMGRMQIGEHSLFWVRLRLKDITRQEAEQGMVSYTKSPVLRSFSAASCTSWGGTIPATNSQQVQQEFLGRSDGSAGQRFQLQCTPILPRRPDEMLNVEVEGESRKVWKEVSDFAETGSGDFCFTLDSVTGELRFGPAVRKPDGAVKLYGEIPPRGARLVFSRYRYGGGEGGNVLRGAINTLKTSIPYVAKVANRTPASGGLDAETLEEAMLRAPALLRSRGRAVNETDYEFLAMQNFPAAIGRVKCLQPTAVEGGQVIPGLIYVLVIPRISNPEGYLTLKQLDVDRETITALKTYLDERRLLTTRLDVRSPVYQWAAIKVKMRASPGADREQVQAEVLGRLYRFINPLIGGLEGKGWPFDRDLFLSDIYQCLQGTPNVQFIRNVEMYKATSAGVASGQAIETLEIVTHGTLASGRHTIEFV